MTLLTQNGVELMPAQIVSFTIQGEKSVGVVTDVLGREFRVYVRTWDRFTAEQSQRIIPAAPGFFKLEVPLHTYELSLNWEPIVAWAISDGFAMPIATDIPVYRNCPVAILCPDGRVVNNRGCKWPSKEAFEEATREKGFKSFFAELKDDGTLGHSFDP